MQSILLSLYYTALILGYLGIVYALFKYRKRVLSEQVTQKAMQTAKIIRIVAIAAILGWLVIITNTVLQQDPLASFALVIIWPIGLMTVFQLMFSWEKLLRYKPVLIYVGLLVITAVYINLIALLQNLIFNGVPGATF